MAGIIHRPQFQDPAWRQPSPWPLWGPIAHGNGCEDAAYEGFLWELRYAAPMGLEQLGLPVPPATLTGSQPSSHARRHGLTSPVSSAMA